MLATPSLVAFAAVLPHGVSDLLVTLAITALVTLGLLHGIWLLSRQLARINWQVAKSKSRTKSGVLGLIATLGRGSTAAALAAEKVARMEDDILQVDAKPQDGQISTASDTKSRGLQREVETGRRHSAPDLL